MLIYCIAVLMSFPVFLMTLYLKTRYSADEFKAMGVCLEPTLD